MRESGSFSVGGHEYTYNTWSPDFALENLAWLTRMVGEPVLEFLMNADGLEKVLEKDVKALGDIFGEEMPKALKGLMLRMNEKEIAVRIRSMVDPAKYGALRDGKKFTYDDFRGSVSELLKVFINVLKIQYADFFGVLPGLKGI